MKGFSVFCLALMMLFCGVVRGAVDNFFNNDYGTNKWNNVNEWSLVAVPDLNTQAWVGYGPGSCIIDSNAFCYQLVIIAESYDSNVVITADGNLINQYNVYQGYQGTKKATININGGTLICPCNYLMGYPGGFYGIATINITDGNLIVGTYSVGDWPIFVPYDTRTPPVNDSNAVINLIGGSITAGTLNMTSAGSIDLKGGTLKLRGDKRTVVAPYVNNGWIEGYDGTGSVVVLYKSDLGQTWLTGSQRTNAYIAWNPIPSDNQVGVAADANLEWSRGDTAVSHDVYFGTSLSDVNNATHASPQYKGNQTATLYNVFTHLGWMLVNKTYYWRIDEIDATSHVYKGQVWSFTVEAGICSQPVPGDLNGDCRVDFYDFAIMAENWLTCKITNGVCP